MQGWPGPAAKRGVLRSLLGLGPRGPLGGRLWPVFSVALAQRGPPTREPHRQPVGTARLNEVVFECISENSLLVLVKSESNRTTC